MRRLFSLGLLAVLVPACGPTARVSGAGDAAVEGAVDGSGAEAGLGACPAWGPLTAVGMLENLDVTEASGLAASRRNPGVLWVHNDSGDTERVFAMTETGADLGEYVVSAGGQNDWEDMAVGPGPEAGVSYLYLGSIGGNGGRTTLTLLRAPEPTVDLAQAPAARMLADVERIDVTYPNGGSHDAESLLIDPERGDAYVVTKHGATGEAKVYVAEAPLAAGPARTLSLIATLSFGATDGATTGADMHPLGRELAVRTYGAVWTWRRARGESWATALERAPCEAARGLFPDPEPQGEAIAYSADGDAIYTTTEAGWNPAAMEPLHRLARLEP